MYKCKENPKITAICYGSNLEAQDTRLFITEVLKYNNYDEVKLGKKSLSKPECERLYE